MKKFFREFKEFIAKGSVLDMAVGIVVGNAFKAIVTSLVDNIIMPCISLLTGGNNVADWKWVIKEADLVAGTEETALNYGLFIQSIIDFLIIAFSIFVMLKVMMALQERSRQLAEQLMKKQAEEAVQETAVPAEPVETEIDILADIRALLKEK